MAKNLHLAVTLEKGEILALMYPVEGITALKDDSVSDKEEHHEVSVPEHLQPLLDSVSDEMTIGQRTKLASLLTDYQDVFVGADGVLGRTTLVKHSTETGDAKPIKLALRRIPIAQKEMVDEEIEKMEKQGIIFILKIAIVLGVLS